MGSMTYAPVSVTHGAVAWDSDDGRPTLVEVRPTTNVVTPHVAGDVQVSDVAVTNQVVEVIVGLSEFAPTEPTLGAQADLVCVLKLSDGTTTSKTLYRCKYAGLTTLSASRSAAMSSSIRAQDLMNSMSDCSRSSIGVGSTSTYGT